MEATTKVCWEALKTLSSQGSKNGTESYQSDNFSRVLLEASEWTNATAGSLLSSALFAF